MLLSMGLVALNAQQVSCSGTIRSWTIDVSMRVYLSTHTCSCPSENRAPVCRKNDEQTDPRRVGTGNDNPTGVIIGNPPIVDNSAAEAAERQRAQRKRKEEEFAQNKLELLKILKKGEVDGTINPPIVVCPPGTNAVNGRCVGEAPRHAADYYSTDWSLYTPLNDGGYPIDYSRGIHGLVGGTTWTYGFKRPFAKCDVKCEAEIDRTLSAQLASYCSKQDDTKKCLADGLPFTPDLYDVVISMASYNTALDDLATRVVFDGATFGEFSRRNQKMFAGLTGMDFDVLDCHSNGAMLCLAALRNPETKTTAKKVRLFGPQINPEAALRWQEYAARTDTIIEVYINEGDPIPAISWKQPIPEKFDGLDEQTERIWKHTKQNLGTFVKEAASNVFMDATLGVMDPTLEGYGFKVFRSKCSRIVSLDCHAMTRYEQVQLR